MADLLENYLFTPPSLPPLGLDLVDLRGGGTAPAQYYGTTNDGRKVYCRYRGGLLSVTIGNSPGSDVFKDGADILNKAVGPPLDGSLSLGQLCQIAGITINGTRPPLPNPAEFQERDLSGNTTFFDIHFNSTFATARLAVQRICETLPGGIIIDQILTDKHQICGGTIRENVRDISTISPTIMFGVVPTDTEIERLSQTVQLQDLHPKSYILDVAYNGFAWSPRKFSSLVTKRLSQETGRDIRLAGHSENCQFDSLSFKACFPTSDRDMRQKSECIRDCLTSVFPILRIECIDLKTNQHLREFDRTDWIDPKIADWVASGPDRFLYVSTVQTASGAIRVGFRPRPSD